MAGINARTGGPLEGLEHVKQCVAKILRTRIGTRVIRRDLGSDLPNLIDRPVNEETKIDLYVATIEALDRQEPRLDVESVGVKQVGEGVVEVSLIATYLPNGRRVTLDGIIVR